MSVFPLLILYMALNKKLMEGMTAGAVKVDLWKIKGQSSIDRN